MDAERGKLGFSEQDLDSIFINPPHADWDSNTHADWDSNTNTDSAAVEQLEVDLDPAEWFSSWDDLTIDDINYGSSVNNLSFPADLQAIGEYLIDAELQDSNSVTRSGAAGEVLDVDMDAAEWSSCDDLINYGCSVNTLSFPGDLQAIGEYLIDAKLQDSNTINAQSAAVEELYVDLDPAEWFSSGRDLSIDRINGCSVNNLSLPEELKAIGEYLIDAELQNDNMEEEGLILLSPSRDTVVFQCPIDSTTDPVITEHPAIIAGVQLVSESAKVTKNNSSTSKSMEANIGALGDMEYKGLRLLHLLTACAEAMSQDAQDLVEVILCRLRGLVSPTGSTMERVAYYLFDALLHSNVNSLAHLELNDKTTKENSLGALKLLLVAYPYIRFPHFTANESILEAVAAAGSTANVGIHIIDFDIMDGMQWPPLMQALWNNRNYDVGHLRITAIKWVENDDDCLLYSGDTRRRLTEYASSVGIPFCFQETDLQGLKELLPQEGEIVIVNCIWQLPHMLNLRNKSHLLEFLDGARHLNPDTVTLAMGSHGTESDTGDFLESFTRRLQELCTIFDSLEAGLPEHELARAMVERIFFGPAMSRRVIMSSVRGEHGSADTGDSINVVDLPLKFGYGEGRISNRNIMYAKYTLLCSGGSGSYEVELVGHHRLVLKWASMPLVWVSTWKSPDLHAYPINVTEVGIE